MWNIFVFTLVVPHAHFPFKIAYQVITAGGYREPVTLPQIRTNMDMESHEEKLHNMIKISKQESAREQARDAAASIRERQKEQQRLGLGNGMTGIGGGDRDSTPPSEIESNASNIDCKFSLLNPISISFTLNFKFYNTILLHM